MVIPNSRVRSHALLTRAPLCIATSFDLHVLGLPPAFVLSQDQTLMFNPKNSKNFLKTHTSSPDYPKPHPLHLVKGNGRPPTEGSSPGQSRWHVLDDSPHLAAERKIKNYLAFEFYSLMTTCRIPLHPTTNSYTFLHIHREIQQRRKAAIQP